MKFVMWEPPADGWIKINTNGAAPGSPGIAACVVLFRNPLGDFLGGFAHHMGISFALQAELFAIIKVIDYAHDLGWHSIWLESDFELTIMAIHKPKLVPCTSNFK